MLAILVIITLQLTSLQAFGFQKRQVTNNGCPAGLVPLSLNRTHVYTCDDFLTGCPPSSTCEEDTITNGQSICCQKYVGFCPAGTVAYLDKYRSPRWCVRDPSFPFNTCPQGYDCVLSSAQQPICCGSEGVCPNNRVVVRFSNARAVTCYSPTSSDCPRDSTCEVAATVPPGQYLCCYLA